LVPISSKSMFGNLPAKIPDVFAVERPWRIKYISDIYSS
jgi:hypothetical protein